MEGREIIKSKEKERSGVVEREQDMDIEALQWLTACHCVSSAEGPRVIQDGGKYSQNKYINSR